LARGIAAFSQGQATGANQPQYPYKRAEVEPMYPYHSQHQHPQQLQKYPYPEPDSRYGNSSYREPSPISERDRDAYQGQEKDWNWRKYDRGDSPQRRDEDRNWRRVERREPREPPQRSFAEPTGKLLYARKKKSKGNAQLPAPAKAQSMQKGKLKPAPRVVQRLAPSSSNASQPARPSAPKWEGPGIIPPPVEALQKIQRNNKGTFKGWKELFLSRPLRAKYGLRKETSTMLDMIQETLDLGAPSFIFQPLPQGGFTCTVCFGLGPDMRSYQSSSGKSKVEARNVACWDVLTRLLENFDLTEAELVAMHRAANPAPPPVAVAEVTDDDPVDLTKKLLRSKLELSSPGQPKHPQWGNLLNMWCQAFNDKKGISRQLSQQGTDCIAHCELQLTPENQATLRLPEVITVEVTDPNLKTVKMQSAFTLCKLIFPTCRTYEEAFERFTEMKKQKPASKASKKEAKLLKRKERVSQNSENENEQPGDDADGTTSAKHSRIMDKPNTEDDGDDDMEAGDAKEFTGEERIKEEDPKQLQDSHEPAEEDSAAETTGKQGTPEQRKTQRDFRLMTVSKLRDECTLLQLPSKGLKGDLVQRLEAYYSGHSFENEAEQAEQKVIEEQQRDEEQQEDETSLHFGMHVEEEETSRFSSILSSVFDVSTETSSHDVSVRLAEAGDSAALFGLIKAYLVQEKLVMTHLSEESLIQDVLGVKDPLAFFALAEYNQKPVGFASFCFDFAITHGRILLLKNFYVDKSLTAERVHQQLMSKILNLTKEAGCTALFWSDANATRLFEPFGVDPPAAHALDGSTFSVDLNQINDFLDGCLEL